MIIQDQYGTGLLNTNNIVGVAVKKNDNSDGYVVATIPIIFNDPYCVIGVYSTEIRAEEVLCSIRNAINAGDRVYIMPSE